MFTSIRISLLLIIYSASLSLCLSQSDTSAVRFQKDLNTYYKDSIHSPLTSEDRLNFDSLPFFTIDTTFRVVAKLKFTKKVKSIIIPTTTERKVTYNVYAIAIFKIGGKKYKLAIYNNPNQKNPVYRNHLFLPYTDLTNGDLSYGGGRYVDLVRTKNKTIIIDFNKSYNPYCAYNSKYSCPIPPINNHLKIKIKAGVMYNNDEH